MVCIPATLRDETHSSTELAPVLQRAILAARSLRANLAGRWLGHELDGYAEDDALPVYRQGDGGVLIAWRPNDGWI